jgi:hypothetical protein
MEVSNSITTAGNRTICVDGIVNTTQTINIITGNNLNGTSASEVLIGGTGDENGS